MKQRIVLSDALKRMHPAMPREFEGRMQSMLGALAGREAGKGVGRRLSAGLVAIIALLVLMLGAALAMTSFGLGDFFRTYGGIAVPQGALEAANKSFSPVTYDLGQVRVTVHELIADGRWVYLSAQARAKDPKTHIVFPEGMGLNDPVGAGGDARSFAQAALQEGKALAYVGAYLEYEPMEVYFMDAIPHADGSATLVMGGECQTAADALAVVLDMRTREMGADGAWAAGTDREEKVPFTVRVGGPIEKRKYGASHPLKAAGITLEGVTLTRTALCVYVDAAIHADDPALQSRLDGLLLTLVDDQGAELPRGASMQVNAYSMDSLPGRIRLRVSAWGPGGEEEIGVFELSQRE